MSGKIKVMLEELDKMREPTMPSMEEMQAKWEEFYRTPLEYNGYICKFADIMTPKLNEHEIAVKNMKVGFASGYQLALKEHGQPKKKSKWTQHTATKDSVCPIDGDTIIKVDFDGIYAKGPAKTFYWATKDPHCTPVSWYKVVKK